MIPYSRQLIEQCDIEAVTEALQGDFLTGGSKVEEFENSLCGYLDVKYAVVFNSATSALHVAYSCANLKKDDEVITTPLTFCATSNMLLECGVTPIFCDIKYDGNIDESKIEALITPTTKAIVPVDFGGKGVEIGTIKKLCEKYNLTLIQDCSHALGSKKNEKAVGSEADMAIFSFHAIKPITTFEGGAITTNNKEFYERAKLLRSHGMVKQKLWSYDVVEVGRNYRLSDVACALGISQLKRVNSFIDQREKIARFYDEQFKNNPYFTTIKVDERSSRHLYVILLDRSLWCQKEEIFEALHAKGLGVQVHYKPLYKFSLYKKLFGEMVLPTCEEFYKAQLSIPCHQGMSLEDAQWVAASVLEILKEINGCKR